MPRFGFEALEVYQLALELSAEVYGLARKLPPEEGFGLAAQLKRAVVSVALNIAEGKGRSTGKDFRRFLAQARGSLAETVAALHLCQRLGFLGPGETEAALRQAFLLYNKLASLRRTLAQSS
ncbi:four helix bundle protein [Thermus filiformis]|uniref:30S ribosomal protein S23 n=1 Tax=Thermus filiformis TaxID=276 RepID=A0A0A2WQB5_THEFI|nr:four helix bundle protein [Thermus filiformis]KGQ20957.2 hypothetical protein THFILI_05420 [Thermus filiformis]